MSSAPVGPEPASPDPASITIPTALLPSDGRFGCGPSKIRPEQALALAKANSNLLGSSHRQAPVKQLVGGVRAALRELFGLPDGWEIVLGNGGTTSFWDAATFGLITRRSQHAVFGEFSAKFAEAASAAPHLGEAIVVRSEPGTHPTIARTESDADLVALTHNETSTGVAMAPARPAGGALVAVDATSAAGGLMWDHRAVDVYYFAAQKCFASDGGLWFAACSPAAIERIDQIHASGRWTPASLDLHIALTNSRADQTYNTPAIATLVLMREQLGWMLEHGGLAWCAERCTTSAATIYGWAEASGFATPFVADPAQRSTVVATIDLSPEIDVAKLNAALRANGIVDTDSYRKLGRNQIRVATFPSIEPDDVAQLTRCIDYVVDTLHG